MYYNKKSLVEEKVLQQYYFEKLMLADSRTIKNLIPTQYSGQYQSSKDVKVLQPEVKLGQGHITDFVLHPTKRGSAKKLNIEIKWREEDFLKQSLRFPFYDGSEESGFMVCFNKNYPDGGNRVLENGIPAVYLNIKDFEKWFGMNCHSIISQTLCKKLDMEPSRITGEKYWVVSLTSTSEKHYKTFGKLNNVWAFRDSKRSKNIMRILHGDYIIFALFKSKKGRAVYADYADGNKKIETFRDGFNYSKDLDWSIILSDVYQIERGYHLDFSSDKRYSGFEDNWDKNAGSKEYTQFITMDKYDKHNPYQYRWPESSRLTLDRRLFPADNAQLLELVDAFRKSLNDGGDANAISFDAFQSYRRLLSSF